MKRSQREEEWIRSEWLPERCGQAFAARAVRLDAGGIFNFDAVSEDGKIIACITTCTGKTATGNIASAKMSKIREDALFMLMVPSAERRLMVLTDREMFDRCDKERRNGRMPRGVDFLLVDYMP